LQPALLYVQYGSDDVRTDVFAAAAAEMVPFRVGGFTVERFSASIRSVLDTIQCHDYQPTIESHNEEINIRMAPLQGPSSTPDFDDMSNY
jgi:hypothetical protein